MKPFDTALQRLYQLEGIISNNRDDSGGYTYKGISRNYNPNWSGWQYVDKKDYAQADQLAKDFYYQEYWLKLECDKIDNFENAFCIFQLAVNIGIWKVAVMAQTAAGVQIVDGIIGQITIHAINSMFPEEFLCKLKAYAVCHYVEISQNNPSQKSFLYGWLSKRIFKDWEGK